jgi:magnesium transporter
MLTYFRWADGRIEKLDFAPGSYTDAPPGALHWVDLEDSSLEEAAVLEDPFRLHPLAIEDARAEVHHPKIDDYDSYLFIILHGIRLDTPADELITRRLNAFLAGDFLITVHRGPMRSITGTRELCCRDALPQMAKGVDFLLHHILDQMFDRYFPALDAMEDKIQLLQVEVFERPSHETLDRIFALKQDVMRLRRLCGPQRELINRLARSDLKLISRKAAPYFRDLYDQLYRISETASSYQDLAQGTLDAYLGAVNNRLNETMKRLTVIGAMLAPLTVITSLYGMNFEHMPELRWPWGYPMVLAAMFGVSAGLLYWFKKKQWI